MVPLQQKSTLIIILTTILIVSTQSLTCPNGQFQANITGGLTTACIPTQAMVYDCETYASTSPYTCKCATNSTIQSLFGTTIKGCIYMSNKTINCQSYVRNAPKSYSCVKCPAAAPNVVKTHFSALFPSACAQDLIPGCLNAGYKQYTKVNQLYVIGCYECNKNIYTGYSAFSQNFDYLGAGNTQNNGKACPAAGQVPDSATTCRAVRLNPNDKTKYLCTGCLDGAQALFIYSAGSSPASECASLFQNLPRTTYQASCIEYDSPLTKNCVKCDPTSTKSSLILVYASRIYNPNMVYKCVPKTSEINGCQMYGSPNIDQYVCIGCKPSSLFITIGLPGVLISDLYFRIGSCYTPGRYIQIQNCNQYVKVTSLSTSLECKTCSSGFSPLCTTVNNCDSNTVGAIPYVNVVGQNNPVCADKSLTDNCDTYATKLGSTEPFSVSECVKCKAGYKLVQSSDTRAETILPVCLLEKDLIKNCQLYNNFDLGVCLVCASNTPFDLATKKCPVFNVPIVSAKCTKTVVKNGVTVCVQCATTYNLVFASGINTCIKRVQKCQNQDKSSGKCIECVPNYILIEQNNDCVRQVKGCDKYSTDGECQFCQTGLKLNENGNQCVKDNSKTENTCPDGQIPNSSGNCVDAIKIDKCVKYFTDGTCDRCQVDFEPTSDRTGCKVSEACPPANPVPGVVYRINARGQCISISDSCRDSSTDYNEDGSCRNCKQGFYAYRGLCYAI